MPDATPLLKGTLDLLVLKTLTWSPMHGFEIAEWLAQRSDDVLGIEDSALYQALHRLEERGLVSAEWGITENTRRARYYKLSPAGRAKLKAETSSWLRFSTAVSQVLAASARNA